MVLNDLVGKDIIWKSNTCKVLETAIDASGCSVLKLQAEETKTTKAEPWVNVDEIRVDVYYAPRPRLFGMLVDVHDGWGKVEWKDADGVLVPFRRDGKTKQLILDKENRPIMTMKIFDMELDDIELY